MIPQTHGKINYYTKPVKLLSVSWYFTLSFYKKCHVHQMYYNLHFTDILRSRRHLYRLLRFVLYGTLIYKDGFPVT